MKLNIDHAVFQDESNNTTFNPPSVPSDNTFNVVILQENSAALNMIFPTSFFLLSQVLLGTQVELIIKVIHSVILV